MMAPRSWLMDSHALTTDDPAVLHLAAMGDAALDIADSLGWTRDHWMDALAALELHERTCQTCMPSMILETHPTPPRCPEGERLHRAQFHVWRCWYEARISGIATRAAQAP